MKIIVLLFLIGGCQEFNSNSFDQELSQEVTFDVSTPAGVRLRDSYMILKENCMSCHTGYHSDWIGYNTNDQWEVNNLVRSGEADESDLIKSLKNVGGDMPLGKSQLSDENYNVLLDWINQI